MQSKSLLIAIAAFAVTTTGAQAYIANTSLLSTEQVAAFAEARELKSKGEVSKARDVLLNAGVDAETISALRKESKKSHQAIREAVEAKDFEAFKLTVANTPLIDIITTEADFDLFVQAHEMRSEGKHDEAKQIFEDLGVPQIKHRGQHDNWRHKFVESLTDEQKEALRVAKEANDKDTVKAILKEAGFPEHQANGHNRKSDR